ncbi:hypothetical protein [uncultured Hoeflea sp.]|uniref:hypothetical protein n=1 Tax=uncultured Hoeflea sp. TaxID=538666 RepID=UPI00263599D1|nr:hypothetical protein [uncultured Hoeflea sp.]
MSDPERATACLRKQYHFRPSPNGLYAWNVGRLIELARGLPVIEIPLLNIAEIDELWWFQTDDDRPTPRSLAQHFLLVEKVDLSFPILLCPQGRVMDGMHRIVKALVSGAETISATRLEEMPSPDHVDVQPADLSY